VVEEGTTGVEVTAGVAVVVVVGLWVATGTITDVVVVAVEGVDVTVGVTAGGVCPSRA
jgi:hypothetical protein